MNKLEVGKMIDELIVAAHTRGQYGPLENTSPENHQKFWAAVDEVKKLRNGLRLGLKVEPEPVPATHRAITRYAIGLYLMLDTLKTLCEDIKKSRTDVPLENRIDIRVQLGQETKDFTYQEFIETLGFCRSESRAQIEALVDDLITAADQRGFVECQRGVGTASHSFKEMVKMVKQQRETLLQALFKT